LMACGKPVIGTNIRGIRDLIKNDVNGYLVRVNDIQDTSNKIERLYINKNEVKRMSLKSMEYIKEYSINKVIDSLKKVY
ncbi:glycosyltransferase, partial [Clostridium perfringens]